MGRSSLQEKLAYVKISLQSPAKQKRWMDKGLHGAWVIVRTLFLVGMSFVLLYPLMMALSVAFRSPSDLMDPSVIWIPKKVTMENLEFVIGKDGLDYWVSLWNTLRLSMISSLLQIASCALVAYGFARFRFKFKGLLFALVIFTIIVPEQVVYIPKYLMFQEFDFFGIGSVIGFFTGHKVTASLLNSVFAMYLPALLGVGIRSGLFIFIFNQFYRNLPKELEEAAYIDGSGSYQTFFRIVLPNTRSAILTVFLFSTVWYWNDYYQASMYFSNMNTLSTVLARLSGQAINFESTLKSVRLQAACLLVVLPMLILFLCFERFFTQGLERTGIVG